MANTEKRPKGLLPRKNRIMLLAATLFLLFAIVMRFSSGTDTSDKIKQAEELCPNIEITEGERELLSLLRDEPYLADILKASNKTVSVGYPVDDFLDLIHTHLPAGAEASEISAYDNVLILNYAYDEQRIILGMNKKGAVSKTVAWLSDAEAEGVRTVYINQDNKTVKTRDVE